MFYIIKIGGGGGREKKEKETHQNKDTCNLFIKVPVLHLKDLCLNKGRF